MTKFNIFLSVIIISLSSISVQAQQAKYKVQTVAFYNLENLFDTIRNVDIYDESFTPSGSYGWDSEKYHNKLENLSTVLTKIGTSSQISAPPAIIGVCEIENREVLEDLVSMPKMKKYGYEIVHEHSPDERGIDNGFLYRPEYFEVLSHKTIFVELPDTTDRTRDILQVHGKLEGEEVYVFVNHWPSRSGGEKISMPNRKAAAITLRKVLDELNETDPTAKIFVMGDFNDDPISPSMVDYLNAKKKRSKVKNNDLFNPYYALYKKGYGTTAWQDAWSLFDMVVVSNSLLETEETGWRYLKAGRYNPEFMLQKSGRFRGYPFRTHAFGTYLNGYSDHFPVFVYVAKKMTEN